MGKSVVIGLDLARDGQLSDDGAHFPLSEATRPQAPVILAVGD